MSRVFRKVKAYTPPVGIKRMPRRKKQHALVTTNEQFELFCAEAARLIKIFGLFDWRVEFKLAKLSSLARADTAYEDKQAQLILSDRLGNKSDSEIIELARHEVLELLLAGLEFAARSKAPIRVVDAERHAVIQRLHNFIDAQESRINEFQSSINNNNNSQIQLNNRCLNGRNG